MQILILCFDRCRVARLATGLFGVAIAGASVLLGGCGDPSLAADAQSLNGTTANVRDFGALGNGVHDDRSAIQAALNSGASFVFVPNGTYALGWSGGCNLSLPAGITIYGESRDGAILQQLPGQPTDIRLLQTGPCINNPPSTPNVTIHDLTLDGNKANQTANEHRAGVFATAAPNVYVHDVTSTNFTGDGFYFYNNTTPRVDRVLATANNRDGLVVSGGVTSGSITNSTLIANKVQQFDSEGGTEANLIVIGNVFDDGGVSKDYAMTVSGFDDQTHSSGWLIDHNTINGSVFFVWTSNMVFSNNTVVNDTENPAVTLWRSNDGVAIRGNTLTNTQTTIRSDSSVYLAGTGVGALPSAEISDNTLIVQGNPQSFGVRAEGCGTVEILHNTIIGTGLPGGTGYAGVQLRPTVDGTQFLLASVHDNTIRNWGSFGITVTSKGTNPINVVDVANNHFDDTGGTMTVAMDLDADNMHAAKDIRVVGNTLSGGCTTLTNRTLTGTHQTWGDRWVVP